VISYLQIIVGSKQPERFMRRLPDFRPLLMRDLPNTDHYQNTNGSFVPMVFGTLLRTY